MKKISTKPRSIGSKSPRDEPENDWRGLLLARVRKLVRQAVPEAVEEVKWRKPSNAMRGVPVWSHDGILCTGETYKNVVKLTFAHGAALPDPTGLFNAGLAGNARRAIDLREADALDERAFQTLVRAAAAYNKAARGRAKRSSSADPSSAVDARSRRKR